MVRRVIELRHELSDGAPRPDSAARRDRPAGPARVPGDLRRDVLPVPRRLRPRGARDRRDAAVPGPRDGDPGGAPGRRVEPVEPGDEGPDGDVHDLPAADRADGHVGDERAAAALSWRPRGAVLVGGRLDGGAVDRHAGRVQAKSLAVANGEDRPSPGGPGRSDCRRRSGGAAGVGHQGAGGERRRCRRAAHRDHRGAGRQAPDPRRGRRGRHGPRRRAAGRGAPRHQQDPDVGRPRPHRHAGFSRRGASGRRLRVALRAAHAAARRHRRRRGHCGRRRTGFGSRRRRSRGHLGRGARPLLQPAGPAQVPEVGRGRDGPGHARRDADGALLRGRRIRAGRAGTPPSRIPAGRDAGRPPVPGLRPPHRSRAGGAPHRRHGDLRHGGRAGVHGAARPAARVRQPPHGARQDDRACHRRCLQRGLDQGAQPRGAPLHRDAARLRWM